MHPDDLAARGIRDGDEVAVPSSVGEVRVEVHGDGRHHAWGGLPSARLRPRPRRRAVAQSATRVPGVSVNDLTDPAVVDDISGNAVLNGVPVTVEPLAVLVAEEVLAGVLPEEGDGADVAGEPGESGQLSEPGVPAASAEPEASARPGAAEDGQ